MSDEYRGPPRLLITHHSSLITFLLLVVVATAALTQSWNRWLDPIIDVGRDLYVPGELLEGKKLYRDVFYLFPPLTPHLLALWQLIFGKSLFVHALLGIVVSAVVATQLWSIGRLVADWIVGAVAAFLFLAFSFTGASTWGCNFIFPYAHAAIFGIALILLFTASLLKWLLDNRRVHLIAALLFGLLASWTKIEFAVVVAGVLLVVLVRFREAREAVAIALTAAVLWLVMFAILASVFADAPPGQHWIRDQILAPSVLGDAFYRNVSGTAALIPNILLSLGSAVVVTLLVFALHFFFAPDLFPERRSPTVWLFVLAVVSLGFVLDHGLFRAWAIFQFLLLPLAWRDRDKPLLILLVLSILCTLRILLRATPDWYGFFLAVPAFIAIPYTLMKYLPDRGVYSRRAGTFCIPVLVALGILNLYEQRQMYSHKRFAVETPRGTFYDSNPDRASTLRDGLRFIQQSGARTLVVIPEGVTLNYFSGLDNPIPFYSFIPIEMNRAAERRVIASLSRRPPDLVVLLSRDLSEYGSAGFGVDYGRDLLAHVLRNYQPARQWRSSRFELLILTRQKSFAASKARAPAR